MPVVVYIESISDQPHEVDPEAQRYYIGQSIPAAVTKLLERVEVYRDPKAVEAIKAEGKALVDQRTWLEDTVIERDQLIAKAKASGEQIHLGELMSIASIKFFEMAPEYHKYKGRVCFRGDAVKDQNGAAAIFQELSANPTNVHDANANLAFGMIPGHSTTQSDALRA